MKKILSIMFSMVCLTTSAQTKLDISLNHLVEQQKKITASAKGNSLSDLKFVNVMVQLQPGAKMPTGKLTDLGISVGTQCGSFASMLVPLHSLEALSLIDEIKAIEQGHRLSACNSISQTVDHAADVNDPLKYAASGLSQNYTGKGVIAAIIDQGIDFNHVNFRNPVTKDTRIKQAIVYRNYNVDYQGKVTDKDGNQIQYSDIRETYTSKSDIDTLTTDSRTETHGSHTSCTVAGSYQGDYVDKDGNVTYTGLQGAAPETDLILAGIGNVSEDFPILDALSVIKTKQEELKEPMVVNISFGSCGDWLDGKTIFPQFYDEYTDHGNKPGIIICQAAGNEGYTRFTIHQSLNDSNSHTIRTDINQGKHPKINIFSDDSTPFDVSIDCYDTDYKIAKTITSAELQKQGYLTCNTYTNHDGRFAATLRTEIDGSLECCTGYHPILVIKSEKDCKIRLIATDFSDYYKAYAPFELTNDYSLDGVTEGDALSSFNAEACTNSVLSVGAWQANRTFKKYNGGTTTGFPESDNNKIAYFSSWIEADDNGISRPDFVSPGVYIISGYNSYNNSFWGTTVSNQICGKAKEEYLEGHTSIIGVMSGTSMATPNATGIIALWLQASPQLTVNQAREAIQASADKDDNTRSQPARYGAGKINALEGLKYIMEHFPTPIHDVVNGKPKGVEETSALKVMTQNGRLAIIKDGRRYNVLGQQTHE